MDAYPPPFWLLETGFRTDQSKWDSDGDGYSDKQETDAGFDPNNVNSFPGYWLTPTIATHPVSQTVVEGAAVEFSVTASGTAPLSYQWRLNGANIAGATSSTYRIGSVVAGSAGSYDAVVSNPVGSVTSLSAALTVGYAPQITSQPVSVSRGPGMGARFSVASSGTGTLSYQWRKN